VSYGNGITNLCAASTCLREMTRPYSVCCKSSRYSHNTKILGEKSRSNVTII